MDRWSCQVKVILLSIAFVICGQNESEWMTRENILKLLFVEGKL